MMKLAICTLLAAASLATAQAPETSGPVGIANKTLDGLTHHGPLEIKNTLVKGPLRNIGPFQVEDSTLHGVNIEGATRMRDVVILGPMRIEGGFGATETVILQPARFFGGDVFLDHCVTMDIEINGDNLVLRLMNGTVVNGNITFPNKNGHVQVEDGVYISGKIVGGQVYK